MWFLRPIKTSLHNTNSVIIYVCGPTTFPSVSTTDLLDLNLYLKRLVVTAVMTDIVLVRHNDGPGHGLKQDFTAVPQLHNGP